MGRLFKYLLASTASLGVFFVALALLGVWWFSTNQYKMQGHNAELEAQAEAVALQGGQACVDTALDWSNGGGPLMDTIEGKAFLVSCLHNAGAGPQVCQGAPAPDDIVATQAWAPKYCAAAGREGDPACVRLVGALQEVCAEP